MLTNEGIALLDRIYGRLSGCNVDAGQNFVDVCDLRAAFGVIERLVYVYSPRIPFERFADFPKLTRFEISLVERAFSLLSSEAVSSEEVKDLRGKVYSRFSREVA